MRTWTGALGAALWLVSGAFAGAAWGWAGMRIAYRFLDVDNSETAIALGVILGCAVALALWGFGWREVRG